MIVDAAPGGAIAAKSARKALVLQVMSTFAQMTDLCRTMGRKQPLHIVAEARGPLLENFTHKLHDRQSRQSSRVLSSDILPTEEMAAGFIAQCAMQPQLSTITKVRHTRV